MTSSNYRNLSSNLKQNLRGLWQKPTALSALASLGAHALLFSTLPFLSQMGITATEPEIREPVEVVELTTEEQRRLPDFATAPPPIQLPRITNPPKPGGKDSGDFSLSPLPKPSTSGPLPSSIDSFFPPPPSIFLPSTPPLVLPFPSQITTIPVQPPVSRTAPAPAPSAPIPAETASPLPNPSAVPKPAETIPPVAVESAPEASSGTVEVPAESTPTESPSPTPRSEAQIRQDLLAEQEALRELYTYNPSGTSVEEAQVSSLQWFAQAMGRDFAENDQFKQEAQAIAYPKQACPLQQSRNATVGVVVDADNQIVSEPKILQSSGYGLFNQEALKAVTTYAFDNTTGEKQAFLIRFDFEYSEEICPPGLTPQEPAS